MKTAMYLVYAFGESAPTKKHNDIDSARAEARRLCDKHLDKEFFVLRVIESIQHKKNPYIQKVFSLRG